METKNKFYIYGALFLISLSALLFEISLTRIFSLILFSNYAFMIVSTALFGIGLSGVILAVLPFIREKFNLNKVLFFCCVMFSFTVLLSFLVINNVPLQMGNFKDIKNLFFLGLYFLSLTIPFSFLGMVIALLFSVYAENISKLYFFDLIGAGLGCLLTVPFFVYLGALGTLFVVFCGGIISGILFVFREGRLMKAVSLLLIAAGIVILPFWLRQEIRVHDNKRSYKQDQQSGGIEYSKWSSLSKIDIAPGSAWWNKRLWIDGGTNESALISFDGKYKTKYLAGMDKLLIAIPYILKDSPDVAIIGSSGGREVLLALNHDPRHVTAIEMDPTICEIVKETYAAYIGDIFADPRVTLVCDEGRSYIKRSKLKFDIIHQINNFTPIAMASGAINLAETYLLTVEAFKEYLAHLKDEGMVVLNRHNTFKIVVLAKEVLDSLGLDAKQHLVVIGGEDKLNNGFYMKKTPFTKQEISSLRKLASERRLPMLYYPGMDYKKNWYCDFLTSASPEKYYAKTGLDLYPPTDDKPFFEHIGALGRIERGDPNMPRGLSWVDDQKKIKRIFSVEDLILLAILFEATLFSLIFVFIPLLVFGKKGVESLVELRILGYFFAVGIAFILIEISLMQKFVLFLGVPVYAIAVVLFAVLSATGVGAFLTSKFRATAVRNLGKAITAIFALLLLANFLLPLGLRFFLGFHLWMRVMVSIIFIAPLGILMGMPFPLGMKILNSVEGRLIPWAWGINGYATVIGSVLAIALARAVGFKMVFFTAGIIYFLGFLAIRKVSRR